MTESTSIPDGGGAAAQVSLPTNSKAVVALVLGIAGMVVFMPLGIGAVVVGRLGRREVDASRGGQSGRGLALAGEVLGWIAVVEMAFILFFIAVVFEFTSGVTGYDVLLGLIGAAEVGILVWMAFELRKLTS